MDGENDLERALRRTLARAAAGGPSPGADLGRRAVGAGRHRWVMQSATAFMVLVAATMVASGMLLHTPEPTVHPYFGVAVTGPTTPPEPTATEPVAHPMPQLDGLAGWIAVDASDGAGSSLVLATGHGNEIGLRHVRGAVTAYRIGDGWAVVTGGEHPRLYWATEQERPMLVLANLDALAVDRAKVAWRRGPELSSATLSSAGRLEQRFDTRVADRAHDPTGFVGETVLLAAVDDSGVPDWAVWRPALDDYTPVLSTRVVEVFGGLPDGQSAVGLVRSSDQPCLALLNVDRHLAVERTACLPLLPAGGRPASVSPDGRWLLGSVDGAGQGTPSVTVLVDLVAAFDGSADPVTEVDGMPGPVGRAVWPEPGRVLYPADGGVVHLRADRSAAGADDAAELLPSPGDSMVLVELV